MIQSYSIIFRLSRGVTVKKISAFLVKRRYIILAVMLVVAAASVFMMQKTNIVTDMTEYLPDNSSMKQGLAIMEEEFDGLSASSAIRLMSTDLSEQDKQSLLDELSALPGVKSVDYDAGSEDYNKDNHSLFVVNSNYDFSSTEMKQLEKTIAEDVCPKYNLVYDTNDTAYGELPLYILLMAMAILLVILFIMCESWFEPLIFLATIGVAILINSGTNAFLSGVSETTNSIGSILQLVLSMDYSFILMNRYRQEAAKNKDKFTSMTAAISSAASSILSSSFTTVVGLLALVFMSFKIGADMGIVLAKGVFISMVCIFTVLPALILLCDKVIRKTAKKVPAFHTGKLAAFCVKLKPVFPCLLIVIFAVTFILRGSTPIAYTMEKPSDVNEVFRKENSIVVLYKTEDEDKMADIAPVIEKDGSVKSVSAYSTTLGKQYTADELSKVIGDMSDQIKIEPWMLNFIYFDASDSATPAMSLKEFLFFISDFTNENPDLLGEFDADTLAQLNALKVFADKDELSKKRNPSEIAALLGMDEAQIAPLFKVAGKDVMSITEFLQTAETLGNAASSITPEMQQQMRMMSMFTKPAELTKERTAAELAGIFGIGETMLSQMLMSTGAQTASIQSLMTMLSSNPELSANLSPETAQKMQLISLLTNPEELAKQRPADELSALLGIDGSLLRALGMKKASIADLMQKINNLSELSDMTISTDDSSLELIKTIITNTQSDKTYAPAEISSLFGGMSDMLNEDTVSLIYKIYYSEKTKITGTMSIEQLFAQLVSMTDDEKYESLFGEEIKTSVIDAKQSLDDGKKQLVGKDYSIMMISSTLAEESDETNAFLANLENDLNKEPGDDYYLIGNSPMQYEMSQTFGSEFNKISLITALAIFLVILLTFRSLSVPVILILVIQSAVYTTMVIIGFTGSGMYYLALLIVQSILMGATVDYGILFTNYYRENRRTLEPKEALKAAYNGSIHTILTSGLIMVLVTWILGYAFADPATGQICHIIALGATTAILLILFVLPGVLVALDRITSGVKKAKR